jgi:pimeloyl-ACP methyl ester carboxylesterase
MGVLEFLSDRRFHQIYVLPPNLETGREQAHRFSYADYGDSSSNAVVLLSGALMGTRFGYAPMDQLANAYNVRIIHVDRPGIGGSDPIELEKRIQIWLGQILPMTWSHLVSS